MTDVSLPVPAEQDSHLAALERRIKVRFRDRGRLFHALIHRSAVNERPGWQLTSNERLEFLGDAVLGVVVAERLFSAYPDASEGVLTVTRASLVCETSLAGWARVIGLGQALVLGRGEEIAGGRDRDALLARGFEALVGAMYLDRGLNRVAKFLDRFVAPTLTRAEGDPLLLDAKSRLQQRGQSERDAVPRYRVVDTTGPQHSPTFTVVVEIGGQAVARGSGRSKRAAEQAAAEAALAAWNATPELSGDDPGAAPPATATVAGAEPVAPLLAAPAGDGDIPAAIPLSASPSAGDIPAGIAPSASPVAGDQPTVILPAVPPPPVNGPAAPRSAESGDRLPGSASGN